MKAFIKGISYYLPETIVTNDDLLAAFPEWDAEKVYSKVGVKERHVSAPDETACDMAEKAALSLFAEYDISPSEIDFILLCTQSPDYKLPSTACVLQTRLGVPTSAGALDFNLGCSGCVYGMAMAKGLLTAGCAKNILLITSETYTKYLHPSDISNRTIFGDGAAACLISSDSGIMEIGDFVFGTDGTGADKLIVKTGGARCPDATGIECVDDDGHVNREDYLYMNGSAVFNFTLDVVPPMISRVLEKNDILQDAVDFYVFHQANKFMLSTLRKLCGLPKDKFYINLDACGNTVSSTVLIGLKECLGGGRLKSGMTVMIAGFGVGFSYASSILYVC